MFSLREIIGLILWWSEGTKSRRDKRWRNSPTYPVEITNTDPRIIRAFLQFLRKDIGVQEEKLKVQIQIHMDNDLRKSEEFWSKITNIPRSRFHKTIIRPLGRKSGKTRGTCKVRYTNKAIHLALSQKLATLLEMESYGD